MQEFLYLLIGAVIGAIGTLIGAGGGFILVPVLLFAFPGLPPARITAISLFAVTCNASSGAISYYFKSKVHLKSALYFTLASIPGALIGASITEEINREFFGVVFSILIFTLGVFLLFKKKETKPELALAEFSLTQKQLSLGITISFVIGFIASFLGIGGGIIHVPLLTEVLSFPVHLATGTSHFILALTALVATLFHYFHGELDFSETFIIPIGIGMIIGAQFGAYYSRYVKGTIILKILGVTLSIVALRLLYTSL